MLTQLPEQISSEWLTGIFILILVALAWVRVNYARRFVQLFSAVFNLQMLRQLMRQELVFSHRASIVLSVIYMISMSTFLFLCDSVLGWGFIREEGILKWLNYLLLVFLVYLVKILSIQLVQDLADGDFGLSEYRYNLFIIAKAAGLVLLPVVVLMTYSRPQFHQALLLTGVVLIALFLAYRWFRGIGNALRMGVSSFYIILYFCTLEILPLVLLYKVIIKG